jgi:hypothetical protein
MDGDERPLDARIRAAFDARVEPVDLAGVRQRAARSAAAPRTPRRPLAARAAAVAAVFAVVVASGWLVSDRGRDRGVEVTTPATAGPAPSTTTPPMAGGAVVTPMLQGKVINAVVSSGARLYLGYRTIDMTPVKKAGGVAVVDRSTGELVADHALTGSVERGAMVPAGGAVWVATTNEADPAGSALYRIDEDGSGEPQRIDSASANTSVAASGDDVWVLEANDLQRRSAGDGSVVEQRHASGGGWLAATPSGAWSTAGTAAIAFAGREHTTAELGFDASAGTAGRVHADGDLILVEQGSAVVLVDARRQRVIGTLAVGTTSERPIIDSGVADHVLWVLTGAGELVALDTVTGARASLNASSSWATAPTSLFAESARSAVVCFGDDTIQAFCRRVSTDTTTGELAFSRAGFGVEALTSFRSRVTASDALIDRAFVPVTIDDVARLTSVAVRGHVIGTGLPMLRPVTIAPGQGSLPNGDVVTDGSVLFVRVDQVDRRSSVPADVGPVPGDVIAVPFSTGIGQRSQAGERRAGLLAAIAEAPVGGEILVPLDQPAGLTVPTLVDPLALGSRPLLALADGSNVRALEPTLDAVIGSRRLDDVAAELVARLAVPR